MCTYCQCMHTPKDFVPNAQDEWKKAQRLIESGWHKLAFKMGNYLIVPSSKLIDELKGKSAQEKKKEIEVSSCAR